MKRILSAMRLFGIDPSRMISAPFGLVRVWQDLKKFRSLQDISKSYTKFGKFYPCLEDSGSESGSASGHYFHQDLNVARRIFSANPRKHVDVASRVDGFVAHVAVFREIEVFDIRKLTANIKNISFTQCDIMANLPENLLEYCDSISCLHALEHFGLGRYGDPLDPNGHLKGLKNLYDALEPGGTLYLAVPIGPHRIEFNAHRVFGTRNLVEMLSGKFSIERFSYVDDAGDFFDDVDPLGAGAENNFGCFFGLGIVEARKLQSS